MTETRTLICVISLLALSTAGRRASAQIENDPLLGRDRSQRTDDTAQPPSVPQNPNPPKQQPKPAQPQPEKKKRNIEIFAGPDVGVFVPASSKTKSRFGSSWFGFGGSLGSVSVAKDKGSFGPDFSIISQSNNNDYADFLLVGVEYSRSFLSPSRKAPVAPANDQKNNDKVVPAVRPRFVPYYGVGLDFAVGDLRSIEDNVHAGIRTGAAASLSLGVTYKNRAYIQAKYRETTVIKGFDLSGFSLSAGYRFKL